MCGKEHPLLCYNSGFFLASMGIADKALFGIESVDKLLQMEVAEGKELPLRWEDWALDIPICRAVDRQRVVDPKEPMQESRFRRIFEVLLVALSYVGILASVHQIRRELGGLLNSKIPLQ
jgi:hypothetical protein